MSYDNACIGLNGSEDPNLAVPFYSNYHVVIPYISNATDSLASTTLLSDNNSHFGACHFEQVGESVSNWFEMTIGSTNWVGNSFSSNCDVPESEISGYSFTCYDSLIPGSGAGDEKYLGCTKIIKPIYIYIFNRNDVRDSNHPNFLFFKS